MVPVTLVLIYTFQKTQWHLFQTKDVPISLIIIHFVDFSSNLGTYCYSPGLDLGSLGPSTVTLIALLYVATCGGFVETVMVNENDFPVNKANKHIELQQIV